jgi:hypothetical protein
MKCRDIEYTLVQGIERAIAVRTTWTLINSFGSAWSMMITLCGEDQAKPTVWPDFVRMVTKPKSQDRSSLRLR